MSEQTAFKLKGAVPADPSGIQTRRPDGTHRVVITGMGAISPAGVGVEALCAGDDDAVRPVGTASGCPKDRREPRPSA